MAVFHRVVFRFFVTIGCETVSLWNCRVLQGSIIHPQMIHTGTCSSDGVVLTGETRWSRSKTCPSATLSTTNPTCTALGANLDLRDEKSVINCLGYGAVEN
jgi:hypothetical protein